MKKYMLIIGLIISGVYSLSAQNQKDLPPAEERAQMQTEMMTESLSLTEDQIPQVKEINLKSSKEIDKLKELTNRRKKFSEFRRIDGEKDKALKEVLTKDQYKLYQSKKEEMKKKMKEQRKSKQ